MGDEYDDDIAQGINYRRWLQIKRVKQLCNKDTSTNKWHGGYNLRYKIYYIWRCLIQNANFLTKHAELDLCGDETSWATESYGEEWAGLTGQFYNKPGITKGGQTVLVSDVHRISLCV